MLLIRIEYNNLSLIKGLTFSACNTNGVGCTCTTSTVTTCTACSRTGSDYSYLETLSPLSATGQVTNATVRTITINGCPNHAFTDYTPNTACKGTLTMTVPALPRYMSSTTTSLASTGGNHNHILKKMLSTVNESNDNLNSCGGDSVRRRYCVLCVRRRRFRKFRDQLRQLCSVCGGIHLRPVRRALVRLCSRGVPCSRSTFMSLESVERHVHFCQSALRLHDGW